MQNRSGENHGAEKATESAKRFLSEWLGELDIRLKQLGVHVDCREAKRVSSVEFEKLKEIFRLQNRIREKVEQTLMEIDAKKATDENGATLVLGDSFEKVLEDGLRRFEDNEDELGSRCIPMDYVDHWLKMYIWGKQANAHFLEKEFQRFSIGIDPEEVGVLRRIFRLKKETLEAEVALFRKFIMNSESEDKATEEKNESTDGEGVDTYDIK